MYEAGVAEKHQISNPKPPTGGTDDMSEAEREFVTRCLNEAMQEIKQRAESITLDRSQAVVDPAWSIHVGEEISEINRLHVVAAWLRSKLKEASDDD